MVNLSLIFDLEYRTTFWANLMANIAWTNLTLFTILVLNYRTGGFGRWTSDQMLLLTGMWVINNSFTFAVFYGGLKRLLEDIFTGKLDFILLKPVDSQFYSSTRRIVISNAFTLIEGLIITMMALSRMGVYPKASWVVAFFILILIANIVYYSLWFMVVTLGIHWTMVDNLFQTVPEVMEISKFPSSAYPKFLAYLFSSLIPIGLMTTFPAQALMGLISPMKLFYALTAGVGFLVVSRHFWFWSLKSYTSASS